MYDVITAKCAAIMPWIYQDENWPAFTWDSKALEQKLSEVRYRQGLLVGKMTALGFDLRAEASLAALTEEVVQSSAIEGERLNVSEVRSSFARRLGIDSDDQTVVGRDVEGIVDVMMDAASRCEQPLTKARLCGWHAALFPTGRSGMRVITIGDWRPESVGGMQVVSGPIGKERVHFEAPKAARLEHEMTAFLAWFDGEVDSDPLVKAAIAHLWFITLHPFEDGNGRIARAIADMALARADATSERFYSMSAQIERERKEYYRQLERQQRNTTDITGWLQWFLDCLGRSINAAEELLSAVLYKAAVWKVANRQLLNDRQQYILTRMLDGFKGYMNTSKYAKLAKCSKDTALRDIRKLVACGLLVSNSAGGRSTSYRLPNISMLEE